MWVFLKQGSENTVLVGLLQIGAKDFTVYNVEYYLRGGAVGEECPFPCLPPRGSWARLEEVRSTPHLDWLEVPVKLLSS